MQEERETGGVKVTDDHDPLPPGDFSKSNPNTRNRKNEDNISNKQNV